MYKSTINTFNRDSASVIRTRDGALIPFAPDNTDYQAYLKWLAEGNEPLPPDEVTE
jgi:hypothetical protein